MLRLLPELRKREDLAPTIVGYLVAGDLRLKSWGNTAPKPPAGFVAVERYEADPMWKTIRNNRMRGWLVAAHRMGCRALSGPLVVSIRLSYPSNPF